MLARKHQMGIKQPTVCLKKKRFYERIMFHMQNRPILMGDFLIPAK
jgi:hypothetical protein